MSDRKSSYWQRPVVQFSVAIAVTLVAFLCHRLLSENLADFRAPFVTFYPAVMFIALRCGLGPGLVATALAALAASCWILPPPGRPFALSAADAVSMVIFVSMGVFMSAVAEQFRRSQKKVLAFEMEAAISESREELRQQREWLRVTLASIGDAVLAADTAGRVTFINPIAAALTGWREDEAKGRPAKGIFRIINEETREEAEDIIGRVLHDSGTVTPDNHTSLVNRNGLEIPIEASADPIKDESGTIEGVVLVFRDMTEKRRAQESLRESERRVRLKLESILSPEGDISALELGDIIDIPAIQVLMNNFYALAGLPMAIIDLKGKVLVGVGWQSICTKFHRVHPETSKNCVLSDTVAPSGLGPGEAKLYKCKNNLWDMATPITIGGKHFGNIFTGQFFIREEPIDYDVFRAQSKQYGFPEGEYFAALESVPRISRTFLNECMAFLARLAAMLSRLSYSNIQLARSLAERNVLMESLHQKEEALREANQLLGRKVEERTAELTLTMNQLRALAGELTLAEQRERRRVAQVLHDQLQQLLVGAKYRVSIMARSQDEVVRTAACEVEDIISESIHVSRSLTTELSPPILHTGGLLTGLEWLCRWISAKHGLSIELGAENELPPLDDDVKILVFESVRELLFNAVKHSGVRSAKLKVMISDNQFQVLVEDDGAGFDPGKLIPPGATGGGFGLFSIQERINLIGGTMRIDSAPGQGSRFVLALPFRGTPPTLSAGPPPDANGETADIRKDGFDPSHSPVIKKMRVLLADDHAVMRDGLGRLLSQEPDIEIAGQASNGLSAVEMARNLKPDVVLMDVNMPTMGGIEATRLIREELPEVKVIALSMFDESDCAREVMEAGASAFLSKSGASEYIIAAIRTCMK